MQIEGIKKRWLDKVEFCAYTGLSFDQLEHALRQRLIDYSEAANGVKRFDLEKVDAFMEAGKKKKPQAS